jgi:parvulin-like peptidyl-prolyl isomerase
MPNQKIINKKHLAHLQVIRRQDRIIRISALVIIVLVVAIVGYGVLANSVLLPYREVAVVNGDKILAGEFQTQVKIQRIQAINRYTQYLQYAQMFGVQDPVNDPNFGPMLQKDLSRLQDTAVMGQEVVDLLISDRLIRQETSKRGITVSKEEKDKVLQESFNYFPNGTATPAPTATTAVEPTINPTSLAIVTITPTASPVPTSTPDPSITPTVAPTEAPTATAGPSSTPAPSPTPVDANGYQTLLKERLDGLKKDTGMDEAAYQRLIETSLLRDKLMEEITKDMKPAQEQVWARHILVATKEEAQSVIDKLKAGEDFATLAASLSTDTGSKDKGGDLGWFGKGAMVAPFEEAAFALAVGEISAPVQSDFGFHVIQVIGHEDRPLSADQFTSQKQKAFDDFLTKLRESATITINDVWKTIVPTDPALPTTGQ